MASAVGLTLDKDIKILLISLQSRGMSGVWDEYTLLWGHFDLMRWEESLNDTNSVFLKSAPNVSWLAIGATAELNQHVTGQEKQQPKQIVFDV